MDSAVLHRKLKDRLKENVVIRDYVVSAVGGVVDYLVVCDTVEALIEAVGTAREAQMPTVVIGQGSNVLFSDVGYAGLVIVNRTSRLSVIPEKSQIIADSGVVLSRLMMEAAARDLTGLEFFASLRGTIGGATVNNRQANGVAIGKFVKGVTVLMPDGQVVHQRANWLDFEPFASRLMRVRAADPTALVPTILTVTLQLSRNKKEEIVRKIQHFSTLNKKFWPLEEPSIGPVFRDPSPDQPAEAFLQDILLKKMKTGRARIYPGNHNFILTHDRGLGAGKTADIAELVVAMKKNVFDNYGAYLEEAFEYIGNWEKLDDPVDSLIEYE